MQKCHPWQGSAKSASRLVFGGDLNKSQDFWENILCTAKQKLNFLEGPYLITADVTQQFRKRSFCVIFLDCSPNSGPGRLAMIDVTMNSALFRKILSKVFRLSICDLKLKHTWTL